jgi:hypothetical protein
MQRVRSWFGRELARALALEQELKLELEQAPGPKLELELELGHRICLSAALWACCPVLEHSEGADSGTFPYADAVVAGIAAFRVHFEGVAGASLACHTEADSADCGHSSNRHSRLAARLDMTWLCRLMQSRAP